jgi:hypothetical protein
VPVYSLVVLARAKASTHQVSCIWLQQPAPQTGDSPTHLGRWPIRLLEYELGAIEEK